MFLLGPATKENPLCQNFSFLKKASSILVHSVKTVLVAYDSRQTCGQFQYAEPCAQMKSETFFFPSLPSPGNL